MKNFYLLLNIIGLILDLIGFVGIYLTKNKNITLADEQFHRYLRYRFIDDKDLKSVSREIMSILNKKLTEINNQHIAQDKKTLKFFLFVIIGVILQMSSIIVYFCQSQF